MIRLLKFSTRKLTTKDSFDVVMRGNRKGKYLFSDKVFSWRMNRTRKYILDEPGHEGIEAVLFMPVHEEKPSVTIIKNGVKTDFEVDEKIYDVTSGGY